MGNMVHGERTQRIGFRMTPEEAAVVSAVAEETGLSASDVVRQAIRTAHADSLRRQTEAQTQTQIAGPVLLKQPDPRTQERLSFKPAVAGAIGPPGTVLRSTMRGTRSAEG